MQRHRDVSIKEPRAIIIMGVSGSGKSTLAALLAEQLDRPFFEGDTFHSQANIAKMAAGEPLHDDDRWPWLDRLGAAIDAAVQVKGAAVAACSALKHSYRDRLRSVIRAPVSLILLDASRDELMHRLQQRPNHYMPASLLDSQLATLERPDAQEQALTLDGCGAPEALAEAALAWLSQPQAVRAAGARRQYQ